MRMVWKKGAAVVIAAAMCAGALSGCGKKSEAISGFTFNGKKVDGDLVNFVLRYEQSSLDDVYAYYASMMQQDIWSMDDGQGLGITTWDNFKSSIGETVEKLLLAEEHAGEYDVSLTEEDKKAIADAADSFLAANDKDALASMSATKETVERYLTLSTLKARVEVAMAKDVDTNVSDEEAAQRTVDYIKYTPTTEAQTEAESESEMAGTEADVENTVETEGETFVQTEAEPAGETMTEKEESSVETEKAKKTRSADETEDASEAAQALTEAEGIVQEAESETEDPLMAVARVRYREMAEQMFESLQGGDAVFDEMKQQVTDEAVPGVTASSFTFGKDDTYPDAEIIEATNDLEDGTLVDRIVEAGDSYYILYVTDAFDEEATESKKEEIVDERKHEKIDEIYEKWIADEKFEVDSEKLGAILKDRSYTAPASEETEASQGTLMTEETELHMEVTYETDITVDTESEDAE